jgi:hypothetical protein
MLPKLMLRQDLNAADRCTPRGLRIAQAHRLSSLNFPETAMRTRLLTLVLAAVLLAASQAQAAPILFTTTLAPEVFGSAGSGEATVELDPVANLLSISFDFQDLTGPTTVAHIHCCVLVPGTGTAGVATYPGTFPGFPSGVTSGSFSTTIDLSNTASYTATFLTLAGGTAEGAEAFLLANMLDGRAYLNVHTTFAPGGEIRGFLRAAPEPGTLFLVTAGIGTVILRRRRQRRSPLMA